MDGIVQLNIFQFALVYLLLVVILVIMKNRKINQVKLLLIASVRMTVQLVLAGLVLTYIFKNPHPLFTVGYIVAMIAFSIYTVLSRNKGLNKKFKIVVGASLSLTGIGVILFFILAVVGVNFLIPSILYP